MSYSQSSKTVIGWMQPATTGINANKCQFTSVTFKSLTYLNFIVGGQVSSSIQAFNGQFANIYFGTTSTAFISTTAGLSALMGTAPSAYMSALDTIKV
jgi:hypothetical protein